MKTILEVPGAVRLEFSELMEATSGKERVDIDRVYPDDNTTTTQYIVDGDCVEPLTDKLGEFGIEVLDTEIKKHPGQTVVKIERPKNDPAFTIT